MILQKIKKNIRENLDFKDILRSFSSTYSKNEDQPRITIDKIYESFALLA